jgi:hypothetical protein
VDQSHGLHPVLAFLDGRQGRALGQGAGLQVEQTHDHLQVVFHPVMNLLQQPFFFQYQRLQRGIFMVNLLLPGFELPVAALLQAVAV